jgi:radical SAM protein with 4Fe4S-binding SPASM domain
MNAITTQRDFFKRFISHCPFCGQETLDSVLKLAENSDNGCPHCLQSLNDLKSFWQGVTQKPDEIRTIASNKSAQRLLRKIFFSYSKRGIHKPLILPSTLKIEVTNRCNLKCKHCLANSGTAQTKELPLGEIERILIQANELGVKTVGLVGGEPLLRKDLSSILDILSRLRMSFSISTNAMLMSERMIAAIKRNNLLKVSVSIDGNEEWHNRLRGHINAYKMAVQGIHRLTKEKIKVAVAMVVTRDNYEMIEHVLEMACQSGANFFAINDLIPTGRGYNIRELCLSYAEYMEVTKKMRQYSEKYKGRITILWKGMRPDGTPDSEFGQFIKSTCGAALSELTIDNEGYVLPCPFLPKTNENVLQSSLQDIWYHSDELKQFQMRDDLIGGCGACDRKLSCSGCRARALAHTGNIYGPDIRCPRCQ